MISTPKWVVRPPTLQQLMAIEANRRGRWMTGPRAAAVADGSQPCCASTSFDGGAAGPDSQRGQYDATLFPITISTTGGSHDW